MEHGQQGAESVGAILSGIAELLREVSDKLDSVAARVGEDNGVEARLKKLEAWAFRTEQNVSALETRVDDVTSGASVERAGAAPLPRAARRAPAAPTARLEEPRPESLRAENSRAETPRTETSRPETLRTETSRPETLHTETLRAETSRPETPRPEAPRAERLRPSAPLRPEPAPEPSRTDSLEAAAIVARVEQQTAPPTSLPRRDTVPVPAALHDWVEPNVSRGAPYDAAPEPVSNAHAEPAEIAPRTETPQERLGFGTVGTPVVDTSGVNMSGVNTSVVNSAPRLNGRLEAPTLTSRADTTLTAPRDEPAAGPTQHHATVDDNSHVDKLQAMLDELKRNPAGPFGRPLSSPPGDPSAQ
ncbi:hypothetical protein [Nocardia sp. NPDC050793]|uniref:hypothetical protein n=1 Tax=Nocardia sp. NPDC050793 TaxID=3155159 RepID=UPI0033CF3AA6